MRPSTIKTFNSLVDKKEMNHQFWKKCFVFVLLYSSCCLLQAQTKDTVTQNQPHHIVSGLMKPAPRKYNPKIAAALSAILPGAGQAYNKKYWKIPIIYGVLGWFGYDIYSSYKLFNQLSFALVAFNKAAHKDSTDFKKVDPIIQRLPLSSVENYKNNFRKQIDESSLWLLIVWGLNIVDAAVDAQLKTYDVSDNLTLKIQPQILPEPISNNLSYNLKLNLSIKQKSKKSKFLASVTN